MHILKTLKPIRMNGKIIQPGQIVKVTNEPGIIDRGYARMLTKDETRAILSEYITVAERLFMRKQIPLIKSNVMIQGKLL